LWIDFYISPQCFKAISAYLILEISSKSVYKSLSLCSVKLHSSFCQVAYRCEITWVPFLYNYSFRMKWLQKKYDANSNKNHIAILVWLHLGTNLIVSLFVAESQLLIISLCFSLLCHFVYQRHSFGFFSNPSCLSVVCSQLLTQLSYKEVAKEVSGRFEYRIRTAMIPLYW
jgi:hypothetical protein